MSLARMAAHAPTLPYERHRPEETLLYQLIETYYPAFRAQLEAHGQTLPAFVKQEFDDFLKCGRLDYGFLRVCCEDCKHERLVAFSCKRRGFSLHAGVMAQPHQRNVLERLCRYISRPAVSEKRLALTGNGKVRYELKWLDSGVERAIGQFIPQFPMIGFR